MCLRISKLIPVHPKCDAQLFYNLKNQYPSDFFYFDDGNQGCLNAKNLRNFSQSGHKDTVLLDFESVSLLRTIRVLK